jgi:hypothetical protein
MAAQTDLNAILVELRHLRQQLEALRLPTIVPVTPAEDLTQAGDVLIVTAWNSVVGQTLRVVGLRRTAKGFLVPFGGVLSPSADRMPNQLVLRLGETQDDTLVRVAVLTDVPTQRGQTFVRLAVGRSMPTPSELAILAQDYVTVAAPLAWPGGRIASPTEGPGAIRSITGTDPAAGVEISETVPSNTRWRLIIVRLVLATDATVGNRRIRLVLDDGVNVLAEISSANVIPPNVSNRSHWMNLGYTNTDAGVFNLDGLPSALYLAGGYRIRSTTVNLALGDNYGPPQLLVEEWITV